MERSLRINSFILIVFFLLSSCATNEVRIDNVEKPVAVVQAAVAKSMPLGKPKVNKSNRKFTSKPFLYKGGKFVPASNSRVRYIAVVEVLGDRRPYSVFIEVINTQRVQGEFVSIGKDVNIANHLSKSIQFQLSKSLNGGNAIDDFRVF